MEVCQYSGRTWVWSLFYSFALFTKYNWPKWPMLSVLALVPQWFVPVCYHGCHKWKKVYLGSLLWREQWTHFLLSFLRHQCKRELGSTCGTWKRFILCCRSVPYCVSFAVTKDLITVSSLAALLSTGSTYPLDWLFTLPHMPWLNFWHTRHWLPNKPYRPYAKSVAAWRPLFAYPSCGRLSAVHMWAYGTYYVSTCGAW